MAVTCCGAFPDAATDVFGTPAPVGEGAEPGRAERGPGCLGRPLDCGLGFGCQAVCCGFPDAPSGNFSIITGRFMGGLIGRSGRTGRGPPREEDPGVRAPPAVLDCCSDFCCSNPSLSVLETSSHHFFARLPPALRPAKTRTAMRK